MNVEHVTVSLTTISSRLNELPVVLESLLMQDYASFVVQLNWSEEPFLLDEGVRGLPENLKELAERHANRLRLCRVPNIASYRKLLPILAANWGRHRLVATADDDTVYPSDWLSTMVKTYQEHRCIVCYRGHRMARTSRGFAPYRRWMTSRMENNPDIDLLPTGKDGVLYNTAYFHPAVLDYNTALEIAPTADDLWFKWHTAVHGVGVYCINPDYREGLAGLDTGESLYEEFNRTGRNDETLARLEQYGIETLDFAFGRYDPVSVYEPGPHRTAY